MSDDVVVVFDDPAGDARVPSDAGREALRAWCRDVLVSVPPGRVHVWQTPWSSQDFWTKLIDKQQGTHHE